jgi:hypothetical protein
MTSDIREELAQVIANSFFGMQAGEAGEAVVSSGDLQLAQDILASPLLDRIKREAAAEALEGFANEYVETRIRASIASPNVGDYWAGAHDAAGHAVDSLRSHAEFLRKGHE